MSEKPSELLLQLLRDAAETKNLNTLAVAEAANLDAERVHQVMGGHEPITVDEFVALAYALDLGLEELGVPAGLVGAGPSIADDDEEPEPEPEPKGPRLAVATEDSLPSDDLGMAVADAADSYGNQPAQIFRLGFALGCDIFFIANSKRLGDSGLPEHILERFPKEMPIRLPGAYHQHMSPLYLADCFSVVLSFGTLYTCRIPWDAFKQVTLFPLAPAPPEEPTTPEEPEEDEKPRRGHLRLVE